MNYLVIYLLNSLFSSRVPVTVPFRISWRMCLLTNNWILREFQSKWDWATVERSLRSRLLMGVLLLLLFICRLLLELLSLFDFEPMKLLPVDVDWCCWWWWCFCCFCCWCSWWRMLRSVRDRTARWALGTADITKPIGSSSWLVLDWGVISVDVSMAFDWMVKLGLNSAIILWFSGGFTLLRSLTTLGTKLLRLWSLCR